MAAPAWTRDPQARALKRLEQHRQDAQLIEAWEDEKERRHTGREWHHLLAIGGGHRRNPAHEGVKCPHCGPLGTKIYLLPDGREMSAAELDREIHRLRKQLKRA